MVEHFEKKNRWKGHKGHGFSVHAQLVFLSQELLGNRLNIVMRPKRKNGVVVS